MPAGSLRSSLLKGLRLGAYEIGALIGHGATASVFDGVHTGLGKRVAIKVLHEHLTADEEMRARFVREGRVAARLEHPNVVGILDVGVEGDTAYLVMERLVGEDGAAYLKSRGKLPVTEALDLVLPVAAALAFAHDRGVVHRDLKPANLFLARDRHGEAQPKIVDFGLSKLLTAAAETAPLTAHDSVLGTLQYMAPEQTFGTMHAGPKADQYALAAILYETLTGQAPFEDESFYGLLEKVRRATLVPPSALVPGLPPELDKAVLQGLARDPEARFADLRAFGRALLPFASDRARTTWERDFSGAPPTPVPSFHPPSVAPVPTTQSSSVRASTKLPCPPGSSPFRIKGMAYRGIVQLIDHRTPGGLEAIEGLVDDDRIIGFLRQPFLAASWYDILPMLPISAAIAQLLAKPLEILAHEQGAQQARHDVETVYRTLFESINFDNAPVKLARFGRQYYDFGDCTATLVSPGHVELRRIGMPEFILRWFAPMHAAYAEQILRMKGATFVEATVQPPVPTGARDGFPVVDLTTDLLWS